MFLTAGTADSKIAVEAYQNLIANSPGTRIEAVTVGMHPTNQSHTFCTWDPLAGLTVLIGYELRDVEGPTCKQTQTCHGLDPGLFR
jgi:hypothetical protein